MLSEHEILELLDRLKSGPGPMRRGQNETLAHWPVLVASGLCLNLQHLADAEFARHPERISVAAGDSAGHGNDTRALADICAGYRLVHHVDTGYDHCSLLIAYDTRCLQVLALLCGNDNLNGFSAASAYDFSLSLADCLEGASTPDRAAAGFLALEFDASMRCEAGWCLSISAGGVCGSLYVGLVGMPPAVEPCLPTSASARWLQIRLRPSTITRSQASGELAIVFSQGAESALEYDEPQSAPPTERRIESSMVHQSLRLSTADVYVLALEALGVGDALTLYCDARALPAECFQQGTLQLNDGVRMPCHSLDYLPLRSGELTRQGDQLIFIGRD